MPICAKPCHSLDDLPAVQEGIALYNYDNGESQPLHVSINLAYGLYLAPGDQYSQPIFVPYYLVDAGVCISLYADPEKTISCGPDGEETLDIGPDGERILDWEACL